MKIKLMSGRSIKRVHIVRLYLHEAIGPADGKKARTVAAC